MRSASLRSAFVIGICLAQPGMENGPGVFSPGMAGMGDALAGMGGAGGRDDEISQLASMGGQAVGSAAPSVTSSVTQAPASNNFAGAQEAREVPAPADITSANVPQAADLRGADQETPPSHAPMPIGGPEMGGMPSEAGAINSFKSELSEKLNSDVMASPSGPLA
jgi:hypothetical protein